MEKTRWERYWGFALGAAALALGAKYVLPLLIPFLLGGALALGAEPAVRLGVARLKLKRGLAAGIGVSVTLVLVIGVLTGIFGILVWGLGQLGRILPDMEQTARQGLSLMQNFLLGLAERGPDMLRPIVSRSVTRMFGSGTALLDQAVDRLPGLATGVLSALGDGALTLGTALISAFMISARLPQIRLRLQAMTPAVWRERWIPALSRIRAAIGGWLKAQAKLSGISFGIITLGLWALSVPYAPVWAFLIALVDALPLLGTAVVLLPWALVSLLQGAQLKALGLVLTYAAVSMTRTVMEPKLLGKQLGLDPLLTLGALYLGYQLWGLGGMLLAPIAAVAATQLTMKEA